MKKVAIMQPYLFPYIGYFQLINAVEKFVIYDDVQYIVRGWINRNKLLINGSEKMITVALDGASSNKLINEIHIKDDFEKFLKTVNQAYSKAPHKHEVMQVLTTICKYDNKNLAYFIGNSLTVLANYLNINTDFIYSSSIPKDSTLRGQAKIIAICKHLEADVYINPINGRELYTKADFTNNGIELKFIKSLPVIYNQFNNEFVPWLSIIDVLMFNSTSDVRKLLTNYELV